MCLCHYLNIVSAKTCRYYFQQKQQTSNRNRFKIIIVCSHQAYLPDSFSVCCARYLAYIMYIYVVPLPTTNPYTVLLYLMLQSFSARSTYLLICLPCNVFIDNVSEYLVVCIPHIKYQHFIDQQFCVCELNTCNVHAL